MVPVRADAPRPELRKREEDGSVTRVPGLFDQAVFDQSVQEFLDKKDALADYFDDRPTDVSLPEGWEPAESDAVDAVVSRYWLADLIGAPEAMAITGGMGLLALAATWPLWRRI